MIDYNIKIKELFDKDFFVSFRTFIFEKTFEKYFNDYLLKNNCTLEDFLYSYYAPDNIKPIYKEINIKSFQDFLSYMDKDSVFEYEINLKIMKILYLFEKMKNLEIQNNYFKFQLYPKTIIENFYNIELTDKLANSSVNSLFETFREQNQFIIFPKEDNLNIIKNNILLFILDYISVYIKTFLTETSNDINLLMRIYKYETKYKLNGDKTSQQKELSRDILKTIRELKSSKYKQNSGRKNRPMPEFKKEDLNEAFSIAKEILDTYGRYIDDIICNNSGNKEKAKKEICNFIADMPYPEGRILKAYFNEQMNNTAYSNKKIVIYKFLDEEFKMGFFNTEEDISAFENMKKWFKRH